MPQQIVILKMSGVKARVIAAAAILCALLFAWFGIRWQVGNMLAELTSHRDEGAQDIARLAVGLAPSDPLPLLLAARAEREVFTPERLENSVTMLENAVRLSPNDFRWWIELGRGYEQAERPDEAELAFRHARALAPQYTIPRWQLGNFYLRQDRVEEAFAEFKLITEQSPGYRTQVFSLAWQYFGHDPATLDGIAVNRPDVQASLAFFYATRGHGPDALRVWNNISTDEKTSRRVAASQIAHALHSIGEFPEALEFAIQADIDPESRPEQITDPGFEKLLTAPDKTVFGWAVARNDNKVEIGIDSAVKHNGLRSLRVIFKNPPKPEFSNISQAVVVRPLRKYRLSFWVRTENLQSGTPPVVQVVTSKGSQVIGTSEPLPTGTNDWQQIGVDFDTPEDCNGIIIRTWRQSCGAECPILGTFWFDDFELVRQ